MELTFKIGKPEFERLMRYLDQNPMPNGRHLMNSLEGQYIKQVKTEKTVVPKIQADEPKIKI